MGYVENYANQNEVYRMLESAFGISVELVHTGGGCMVYEGRLDNGDFVCITEGEDFISDYEQRMTGWRNRNTGKIEVEGELAGRPWGWTIGIYTPHVEDEPEPDEPEYRSEQPYAGVVDHSAFFGDLPRAMGLALTSAVAARRKGATVIVYVGPDGEMRPAADLWGREIVE